ncbi:MAG: LLM class flavin-dependent oxidoreductase [Actinobacteria bacterium]|nr:LLM class flavin-dependent oxidoreductase [Actinomycetota bacterium]
MSSKSPRNRLILNAMSMNTVSHGFHGLWRHPDSRQVDFTELGYWRNLVEIAERGCLDALFLADVVGVGDNFRGGSEHFVSRAVQLPVADPLVLVSTLVDSTEHLGLAFTSSILQVHPFQFARQVSTLDHLSGGRVGWNVVTTAMASAAANFGSVLAPHDERYEWAQEYLDVTYRLWEGSWEERAVRADRRSGLYAEADAVHAIGHHGPRYDVAGPHLVAPSPQRTPVIFQAGASPAGREFAARNAEVQFILTPRPEVARTVIEDVRGRVVAAGRAADDIRFVQQLSFVVGSTEEEAKERAVELDGYLDLEGLLAHMSRDVGFDFGGLDPDAPLSEVKTEAIRSIVESLLEAGRQEGRTATVGDLSRYLIGGGTRLVGTPGQIADGLERWQEAGVDGVNVLFPLLPASLEDFVDQVVPELQRRGLAQRAYEPGTLREKLFGRGARLPDDHPATRFRRGRRPTATATTASPIPLP